MIQRAHWNQDSLTRFCSLVSNMPAIKEPLEIQNRVRVVDERNRRSRCGLRRVSLLSAGRGSDWNRSPDYFAGTVLIVFTIRATIW